MNKMKKAYIIGTGIASTIVIVIAAITILYTSEKHIDSQKNTTVADPDDEVPLLLTHAVVIQINNSALWAMDADFGNFSFVVKNWPSHISSFDFYMKKTIYFTSNITKKPIASLSNRFPKLQRPGDWLAKKIALDFVNGNAYVLDDITKKVHVFEVTSSDYNIVSLDLDQPKDMVLDPINALLFILQISSIMKSNIDGSTPQVIIRKNYIPSFCAEQEDKKIYFSTLRSIESIDYGGGNNLIVTNVSNIATSLAVLKSTLFWLSSSYAESDPILRMCKLVNGVCKGTLKEASVDRAVEIRAYNFESYKGSTPCKERNNCEYLCTLNNNRKEYCICKIGWRLNDDLKSCKLVDEYLLYIQGNLVKGRLLDVTTDVFVESIVPMILHIPIGERNTIDFDYEAQSHMLFYSGDWSTYHMYLKLDSEQVYMGGYKNFGMIVPAFDWISKNLYYVFRNGAGLHSILVTKTTFNNTIYEDKNIIKTYGFEYPKSLVVHPNHGLLFFTMFDSTFGENKIFRIFSNGDGYAVFGENFTVSNNDRALGIDYEKNRLYWLDKSEGIVYHATLEGSDVQIIDIAVIKNPRTISIYKQWMYISNFTSIWRLDKTTGYNTTKIISSFFENDSQIIYGAKVFSPNMQLTNKNHPCAIDNGGCQRYCFVVPKRHAEFVYEKIIERVCGCNDNEKLSTDGKKCKHK